MSRLSLGIVCALVAVLGCGSSDKPPTGKACTLNSECNNPLSCSFGKCHVACNESRDCQPGQRCIKSPTGNVCQLAEEKNCPAGSACQQPLICAIDLQCHNTCTTPADCTLNQVCAGGACAEKTEVGSDGKLVPAAAADAGAGGAGGSADAAAGGAGGTADAGVDAAPTMAIGPCGVPETEPNDKREQATAIAAPAMFTSCMGTPSDVDFYELTAPSDMSGGYYTISFSGIEGWPIEMTAYTVLDNGEIGNVYAGSDGQNLEAYLAAMPGQKYRLEVKGFISVNNAPSKYTMKVTYTKVDDALEPNNTKDTARMISVGTPVTAYLFEGPKSLPFKDTDMIDWYKVNAAAGNVTVTLEMVPSNVSAYIDIFDPTGKQAYGYSGNEGANATATFMMGPAGTYLIGIKPFTVKGDFIFAKTAPGEVPANFTHPYKMTVSQ